MTTRALEVLAAADLVLCEDTRTTGRLLSHWGIRAKLVPYHDHNAARMRPEVLRRLDEGARVALVSDAGTPLVSDPGYKLVRAVAAAGHQVRAVPGPSALTAALSIAGLPTDRVLFLGFPPAKAGSGCAASAGWRASRRRWCSMTAPTASPARWPNWPRRWGRGRPPSPVN
ncbi:ribosomal RNA small subunit methyltransferase I [Tistrella bauzanensis]